MQAIPIEVEEGGRLRLAPQVSLPSNVQLAVFVLDGSAAGPGEPPALEIAKLAQQSGALDFLTAEPDLYTDADIEPGQHNPDFGGNAATR